MVKVAVFGGGWAGCAAAVQSKKSGGDVILVERTDMLLGTGLVGGIVRNNGRYTVFEELKEMGAKELVDLIDNNCLHKNIDFPKHNHSSLYDVRTIEGEVRSLLNKLGIKLLFSNRGKEVVIKGEKIIKVILDDGSEVEADVFIDTTGSAGGIDNCTRYGNGCAMCILRCPTFGGRISISEKAGINEYQGIRENGEVGALSGACKIIKESLAKDIQIKLKEAGVCIIPIPKELRKEKYLSIKVCQQYNYKEYEENLVLLDCGHAKLMAPYFPLELLRNVPGFEKARFSDPLSGGVTNSVRLLSSVHRNGYLQVEGVDNLFCAGEKAGLLIGHTEAIATGTLAGFNAVRVGKKEKMLAIPRQLAIGEGIHFSGKILKSQGGNKNTFTFSGSILFQHLKEQDLYTTDLDEIGKRVKKTGMKGIFS
ncbi:Pyruvate/2-oxoglutarate dehydrogenase complex, dihydrolipoamide dehydrogenase (E3) component, and related enzymes [Anaerobranca californiensis DSM 14826]|uniref:Pyruvate/2-oxoglutarate dehydrogenase complex, dihydrolipoamide dehydrogenase (E3) component, and related enzymes n=1 Tax=Anaerobranca californiensis DSM 14826 TaxID=1120989 RepID=A0A1M6L0T8_9FIRM|nr:FAD-dependent oxidoreductase [Anaerobranca californiensis]SHJ64793.1 Pyruvate/2-oxoglutarate dehydrogenase complex, dihydrolipoamide dehydrogenase (E3) component, and related enzymes [Anaerobranca californiensis DSM 14826]